MSVTISSPAAPVSRPLLIRIFQVLLRIALRPALVCAAGLVALSACTISTPTRTIVLAPTPTPPRVATESYKVQVARRIDSANPSLIAAGRPQPMLRSVVVVAFVVDRDGRLLKSSVYRTNGDDKAESTALASLRRAAPLPAPPATMLNQRGEVEVLESWLFNNDGRFQLSTLASPQVGLND
jgi:protein TonB